MIGNILISHRFLMKLTAVNKNVTALLCQKAPPSNCSTGRVSVTPKISRHTTFLLDKRSDKTPNEIMAALEGEIKMHKRVSLHYIKSIENKLKKGQPLCKLKLVTLLHCCGELMPQEKTSTRQAVLQSIWNIVNQKGYHLGLKHYNALLKSHLENDHDVCPQTFLQLLQEKKLKPNQTTYQRLMYSYCQKGDLENAQRMLEEYRRNDFPLHEKLFHTLMLGHVKANDVTGAVSLLEVMKEAGLPLTHTTYGHLAQCLAQCGDIQRAMELISKCKEDDSPLLDNQLLDIIHSFAVNGYPQYVPQILKLLSKESGLFNQWCKNTILLLLNRGCVLSAQQVLDSMSGVQAGVPGGVGDQNFGIFYLRHLVKIGMSIELIMSNCSKIKHTAPHCYDHCLQASLMENIPLFFPLMDAIVENKKTVCRSNEEERVIRPHYLWPIICHFARGNRREDVLDVLSRMNKYGTPVTIRTISDYIAPYLLKDDTVEKAIEDMGEKNVDSSVICNAFTVHFIQKRDLSSATDFVCARDASLSPQLYSLLLPITNSNANLRQLAQLITKIDTDSWLKDEIWDLDLYPTDFSITLQDGATLTNFLVRISRKGGRNYNLVANLLQELHALNMDFSSFNDNNLVRQLRAEMVPSVVKVMQSIKRHRVSLS